jgi:DNA-binding transcriptional MocR family regulator
MAAETSREPIYYPLRTHLRRVIGSGEYPAGSKFLTERQVCGRFSVSRVTANKALSDLILVYDVNGDGPYEPIIGAGHQYPRPDETTHPSWIPGDRPTAAPRGK